MSFNVSRFLVRVRQFWTRERLVPVLGITALGLFGSLTYMYFNNFFDDDPIVARHIVINGNAFEFDVDFEGDFEHEFEGVFEGKFFSDDNNVFYWEFDGADHHNRLDIKKWDHEKLRGDVEWDVALEHKRHAFELKRKLEKLHEREHELKHRLRSFKMQDDDGEKIIIMQDGDDEHELIIKRGDGESSVEIIVNGKKIDVENYKEI